jgi:putative transposase
MTRPSTVTLADYFAERDPQRVMRRMIREANALGMTVRRLAKSVHDAGWASFTGMLQYKAARAGRTFAKVDRFFPSTRTCSDCGRLGDKLPLNIRSWTCRCGSAHDRDVNAARNIRAA